MVDQCRKCNPSVEELCDDCCNCYCQDCGHGCECVWRQPHEKDIRTVRKVVSNYEKVSLLIKHRDNFVDLETTKHTHFGTINKPAHLLNYQPPYSLNEIKRFEHRNNIQLPNELIIYLTQVSKSLYKSHLEFSIICLHDDTVLQKTCTIDEDDDMFSINLDGMMTIREVGCGYTDKIVLNGKWKGEIWVDYSIADAGCYKINNSFLEYALDTCWPSS